MAVSRQSSTLSPTIAATTTTSVSNSAVSSHCASDVWKCFLNDSSSARATCSLCQKVQVTVIFKVHLLADNECLNGRFPISPLLNWSDGIQSLVVNVQIHVL